MVTQFVMLQVMARAIAEGMIALSSPWSHTASLAPKGHVFPKAG